MNTNTLNITGGVDEQRLGTIVVYIFFNQHIIINMKY